MLILAKTIRYSTTLPNYPAFLAQQVMWYLMHSKTSYPNELVFTKDLQSTRQSYLSTPMCKLLAEATDYSLLSEKHSTTHPFFFLIFTANHQLIYYSCHRTTLFNLYLVVSVCLFESDTFPFT